MGEKTNIRWCHRTWNPIRGCRKISPGCTNCLTPETLILYETNNWKSLNNVKVGDRLIGFNEEGSGKNFCVSVVEEVKRLEADAITIGTDHSQITGSYDHRFLVNNEWLKAGELSLYNSLSYISDGGKIDSVINFVPSQVNVLRIFDTVELIDIQTSSRTFFANGFATHNCYMFRDQERFGLDPTEIVRTKTWGQPKKWQKEAEANNRKDLVFTASWSDWFIEDFDPWREEAWELVKETPNLIYQILTKRPNLIKDRLPSDWGDGYQNVWLGTSIENNNYVWRADILREIPAVVRFISAEPLLGPLPDLNLECFSWIIVGGESGPNYRDMDLDWARAIRDKCANEKIAFFYKQGASFLPGQNNLLDGKLHEEYPDF